MRRLDYYFNVRVLLIVCPATRDDDMLLYAKFCYEHGYVNESVGFMKMMTHAKEWGLPNFESVIRARRKVQKTEPWLRGSRDAR